MKNKIYYIGILAMAVIIVGAIFKIQHWPGASIILATGISSIAFLFFPMALLSNYRENGKQKTMLYIAAYLTLFFIYITGLFKVMHWPGASILLTISLLLPVVLFLPVYLLSRKNENEESLTNFLYIIFFLVGMAAMSGFLAVDVSRDFLVDNLRITDIADLSQYHRVKTKSLEAHDNNESLSDLINKSDALLREVEKIKKDIVTRAEAGNRNAITKNGRVNIWYLRGLENRDAARAILVDQQYGMKLMEEINSYHAFLMNFPEISSGKSLRHIPALPELLREDYNADHRSSWNIHDINQPMSLILMQLNRVEDAVILAQSEAFSILKTSNSDDQSELVSTADQLKKEPAKEEIEKPL